MFNRSTYIGLTAFAFVANAVISLAKLLIYSKEFDKIDFGLYSIILMISTIGTYFCCLGSIEGLNRQLPLDNAKGNYKRFSYFIVLSFSFCLVMSLVISFVSAIFPHVVVVTIPADAFHFSSVLLLGTVSFNLISSYLRAKCLSLELNIITFSKNLLGILLGLIAYNFTGLIGVIVSEFLILIIFSLIMFRILKLRIFKIHITKFYKTAFFKKIILVGLPFMVSNLILTLSNTIDSLYIQYNKNIEDYAVYAFALIIFTAGQSVNALINQVFQPRFLSDYSKSNSMSEFLKKIQLLVIFLICIFIALFLPAKTIFNFFLSNYFTNYVTAIELFLPIYFGTCLMSIISILEWPQLLNKKGKLTLVNYLVGLIFVVISCFILGDKAELSDFAYVFLYGKTIVFLISLLSIIYFYKSRFIHQREKL